MRILLIEDDRLIGDGLAVGLGKLGFSVDWFKDGVEGKEALFQAPYEAVVLDIGLPGEDGLSVLKGWRAAGRWEPVLVLTARGDVDQRVMGLNSGADDYLAKPFALAEVDARLRALIRRRHDKVETVVIHGDVTFNPETRAVTIKGDGVPLAPKELLLLELFLLNEGKILSKRVIEEKIYSWDEDVQSNAVEVHIHHLRKKLGREFIKTVNKIGYVLSDS